jgi:hypothetical protein
MRKKPSLPGKAKSAGKAKPAWRGMVSKSQQKHSYLDDQFHGRLNRRAYIRRIGQTV